MTDGLAALDRQRTSRRQPRSIPPSRHAPTPKPARSTSPAEQPVTSPTKPANQTAADDTTAEHQRSTRTAPASPSPPNPSSADTSASAPAPAASATAQMGEGELIRTTLHLGLAEDDFLEAVRAAGRGRRPRVDASRSAVARLAIARLAEQLTPDQIVAALTEATPAQGAKGGRPRR